MKLLPENWQGLIRDDPVQVFLDKVHERAGNDPLWHTDFRRAVYNALHKEAEINLILKLGLKEEGII